MIIARTVKEIETLVAKFEEEGFIGPSPDYKPRLSDWLDCMKEEFEQKGMLIFHRRYDWDPKERRIQQMITWLEPITASEYLSNN